MAEIDAEQLGINQAEFSKQYNETVNAIVNDLKISGYSYLTDSEKKLILSLLEIGENHQAVIHAIVRRRQRFALLANLTELGIIESDLTDDKTLLD